VGIGRLSCIGTSRREGSRPIIMGLSFGRLSVVSILISLGLWLHGLIGLLPLIVGTDLAASRRPFAPWPLCRPALGFAAAAGMLLVDPVVAFACGRLVEVTCDPALVTIRTPAARTEQIVEHSGTAA
jgi:hypothetical protein